MSSHRRRWPRSLRRFVRTVRHHAERAAALWEAQKSRQDGLGTAIRRPAQAVGTFSGSGIPGFGFGKNRATISLTSPRLRTKNSKPSLSAKVRAIAFAESRSLKDP